MMKITIHKHHSGGNHVKRIRRSMQNSNQNVNR